MEQALKQRTARGLLWGGIGNGALQLLSLVFGIFLSRLLSPGDYGIVGSITLFMALAGMLSESGFLLALVNKRPIDNRDYNSVFWFNLAIGCACYIILFVASPWIARFLEQPAVESLLRFQSIGFVISASATAPTALLFVNLRVKERSRAQIVAVVVSGLVGVSCAFAGMSYWSLALQNVAYIAVNAFMIWIQARWLPSWQMDMDRLAQLLPFSLKQLAVMFFNLVNTNIFGVLLARFYGLQLTGYYTQGSKWTLMGSSTVKGMIDSVGQPVLRETVEDPHRLLRVFSKLLRFTSFVTFPALLGLGLVSHELIVLTIGEKWLDSVQVMQILCISAAFIPVITLYGNMFNSINRPDIYLYNTIIPGALQLAALCFTYQYGLSVMLWVYVAINVGWLLVWQWCAHKCIQLSTLRVIKDMAPYLVISLVVLLLAAFTAGFCENLLLSLVVKIVVAVTLYVFVLWRLDSVVFRESIDFLLKRHRK